MGFLRTNRLGKRYSSPLAWLIWFLFEMPVMLVAFVFDKAGVLLRRIAMLIVRHVYYVFTRFARWVDGKPGWRPADAMIGVAGPDDEATVEPFDFESYFAESRKRGETLLEEGLSLTLARKLTPEERSDVMNVLAAMGDPNVPVITPMPVPPSDPGKV